jgi:AbrB family looped-hinge helix DNA binding protein
MLMNAHTRMSSKGQIVIPKAVREQMGLPVGAAFEIVRQEANLLLRRDLSKEGIALDEVMSRLAALTKPYRPTEPLPVEMISSVPEDVLRKYYLKQPI